jgi:hypothetical protein
MAAAHADRGKGKKKSHHYHGSHPLSVKPDAGFCYIEVPHVHAHTIHKKHKPLYREHKGDLVFVADPVAYGYDGPTHNYYGHHPVAVDVVLGSESSYASGQQLEFCYLDGPHYHQYEPPPGLTFEVSAGASWYIGAFPDAYVQGKVSHGRVNHVYASIEVQRPEVVFETPPPGYVGPLLDIHVHVPAAAIVVEPGHVDVHGHGHGHGHGRAEVRAGVEIHVPKPTLEIGIGVGIGVDSHHHGKKGHKRKHHKGKKGKHKAKGRVRPRW